MNDSKWQAAKELFHQVVELSPSEQQTFLAENCQDEDLRREVEEILQNYNESAGFIEDSAIIESGFLESDTPRIGEKIGRYQIIREIGRGGMGAVYLATRADDEFKQEVALKIVKRGMDTDFIVNRFRNERQILASLNHPHIARLFEGGTTDDGLPYFVMEYVDGQDLISYCHEKDLSLTERLDLFRKVCAAVSYAHQNLVVHRDLKPSNILVTPEGVPKLLDFGIAKILNSEDESANTTGIFRLLTPEYASPEQIRGEKITTASDVYSLGVLLYELLSGQSPYQTKSKSYDEIVHAVCVTEPVYPSSIVSRPSPIGENITAVNKGQQTKDEGQNTHPKSVIQNPKLLRGDLDNIVIKALRKEPERRYQSVQEFSEDIQRHRDGLPVSAQPDSFGYRAAKFVKRHSVGTLAALLVLLSLVGGIAATTWQAYRANAEKVKAEQRFNEVRKLANLVLFDYHDGIEKLAGSTPIREKMIKDAIEYLDKLSAESNNDLELQKELATAYQKVGDVQGNPYLANLGNQDGALESYRKALAIRQNLAVLNPNEAQTQLNLELSYEKIGDVLWAKGSNAESRESYRKALEICEKLASENKLSPADSYSFVRLYGRVGQTQEQVRDFPGAIESYKLMLTSAEKLAASEPSNMKYRRGVAIGYGKIGDVFHLTKKYQEASENFQKAIVIFEEIANADKSNANAQREFILFLARVGAVQIELGQYEKALETNLRTIGLQEKISKADPNNIQIHFDMADVYMNVVDNLGRMKRYPEAEAKFHQAVSIYKEYLAKNPNYSQAKSHFGQANLLYAKLLLTKGDEQNAVENFRTALSILEVEPVRSEVPDKLAETYEGIGDAFFSLNQKSQAKDNYQKGLSIWQDLQQKGKLSADNANKLSEINQKIQKCEANLE